MKEMLNLNNPTMYANIYIENIPENANRFIMYGISDKRAIEIILDSFPKATFVIADCEANLRLLKHHYNDKSRFVYINTSDDKNDLKLFSEKGKIGKMPKFDVAIMNPPYDGTLHLDILSKIVKIATKVINVSPVRWLQDPLAKWKNKSDFSKYEDDVCKHLVKLDIINSADADKLFGVRFSTDLGIYVLNEKGGFNYRKFNTNTIIDKVKKKWIDANIEGFKKDGYRIKIPTINGISQIHGVKYKDIKPLGEIHIFYNGKKNGKFWYEFWSRNQHSKTTPEISHSIKFNTYAEANNFAESFDTYFAKYVQILMQTDIHLEKYNLLWLNDYKKPWTNKRFCKHFEITGYISDVEAEPGSEWETILNTMEKYK